MFASALPIPMSVPVTIPISVPILIPIAISPALGPWLERLLLGLGLDLKDEGPWAHWLGLEGRVGPSACGLDMRGPGA